MNIEPIEYDVLGTKIKFTPQSSTLLNSESEEEKVSPSKVIESVTDKLHMLREKLPNKSDKDIAILTALAFAGEKFELEAEFKRSIEKIENSIDSILESTSKSSSGNSPLSSDTFQ